MKRFFTYLIAVMVFCTCQKGDLAGSSSVRVVARIPAFDKVNLDTKGNKTSEETRITNMMLLIFDGDDGKTILDRQYQDGAKPLFVLDRDILKSEKGGTKLESAMLMIVANLTETEKGYLEGCRTLSEVNECDFDVKGIGIPESGIPMMGIYTKDGSSAINLNPPALGDEDSLRGSVLEIILDCLYAKVVMNISVDPIQSISSTDQYFKLDSWSVKNIPDKLRLGEPDTDSESEHAYGSMLDPIVSAETSKTASSSPNTIFESASGDVMSITFYVPEHKINPRWNADYPWRDSKTEEYMESDYAEGGKYYQYRDYRQHLKPTMVQDPAEPFHPCPQDQPATYVELKGKYRDHNEHIHNVTYTIYLGADPVKDFYILRNHQYNNNISIRGITNSVTSTDSWVTYDHRVNIELNQFSFGLQRETLLDSHWEIRPIRIDFNDGKGHPDSVVEVIIPDECDWIGIESPSSGVIEGEGTRDLYCDAEYTSTAYGKRRYFTTDLVESLQGRKTVVVKKNLHKEDHTVATLGGVEDHTIWTYIDEYAEPDGPDYRTTTVTCNYYESEEAYNNHEPTISERYIFRQNNIHRVEYNGKIYYIEYYEEYLYNFDTKEQYIEGGVPTTTDGMKWGLDRVQLSESEKALEFGLYISWSTDTDQPVRNRGEAVIGTVKKNITNSFDPKYDFYLPRDIESIGRTLVELNTDQEFPALTKNGELSLSVSDHPRGLVYTKSITSKLIDYHDERLFPASRATDSMPESAVEYCFNRNMRKSDGTIDVNSIKWYLPAIDEIEDICMGGYGEFEVFQDKYYWSSQPSYHQYIVQYTGEYTRTNGGKHGKVRSVGLYYNDDVERARATKVAVENGVFGNVPSGTDNYAGQYVIDEIAYIDNKGNITNTIKEGDPSYTTLTGEVAHTGNQERGKINRVRCVYYVPQPQTP